MDHRKLLQRCAAALMLAVAIRIVWVTDGDMLASLLLLTQTGRVVQGATTQTQPPQPDHFIPPTEITQPTDAEDAPEAVLSFSADDLGLINVWDMADRKPDLQGLLQTPLHWDLKESGPTVLIIHTHATECYADGDQKLGAYRTTNADQNMLAVGAEVARVLRAGGVEVIHDTTLHDLPDYNNSYTSARATVQEYLRKYPSIRLVLDLHRDATGDNTDQLVTAATVGGQRSAQLMIMAGSDVDAYPHPDWQENLALALKLAVVLEQDAPGITRMVYLTQNRYNMDLSPGSLLIEVGGAGNKLHEALIAANVLARGILTLADGSG